MSPLAIIIMIVRVAIFLATEGPELWAKIKEIIGWIRSMDDGGEQMATAVELQGAVDEAVRDWRAGDRSGRRLKEFHTRLAQRRGQKPANRPGRGRRNANGLVK